VTAVLVGAAALLAQDTGPGRGNDPSTLGGIAIIVGVVLLLVVLGFAAHFLVHRFGRTRPEVHDRRTHPRDRVGH
jgi:hypothetical protein